MTALVRSCGDCSGVDDQTDLDLVLLNWGTELLDATAAGWLSDPAGKAWFDSHDQ